MTRRFLLFLLAGALFVGCSVHEVPGDGDVDNNAVVELTVNISFDKSLPQFQDISYDSKADESYQARYVIGLFRYASETPNAKPDYIFAFKESAMENRSYTLEVAPMNYKVVVWSDYAAASSAFYTSPVIAGTLDTDKSFQEVTLSDGPYTGNSPWRDAFYGSEDVKLASYLTNRSQHSMDIAMVRPNARYNFVATDKDQFVKYLSSKASQGFDTSDFQIKISYPQFLPCTYNLFTNKPVDSRTGVEFDVTPLSLSDGNVDLGSDWVFANEDNFAVIVTLSFYDAKGKFISSLNNIEVPLCRGKNTTIKGALLTNGSSSGISIDPSFSGPDIVVQL